MSDKVLVLGFAVPIGVGLVAMFVRRAVLVWRLWRRGVRTRGNVVDHVRRETAYWPYWEVAVLFDLAGGGRVRATCAVRFDQLFRVGQEVPVVYLPEDPRRMRVFTAGHLVGAVLSHLVLLLVGAGLLVFGAVFAARG
ncbi:hypothetical protein ACPC54_06855 [Kitasatospora sp. NPDC094028]